MKRSKPLRRTGKRRSMRVTPMDTATDVIIAAKQNFKDAAQRQRVCAVCGRGSHQWEAHHVIYRKHLRSFGLSEWNTMNALRLCDDLSVRAHCHPDHHSRRRVVRINELTDDNLLYAFTVLGPDRAEVYLERYYDHSTPDERMARLAASPPA